MRKLRRVGIQKKQVGGGVLPNSGLNPNNARPIRNQLVQNRFGIDGAIAARNSARRTALAQEDIFRDRRDEFKSQVEDLQSQFELTLSPDYLDTKNPAEMAMYQELTALKTQLTNETINASITPGTYSQKIQRIQALNSQLSEFYTREDVIKYTQANGFFEKANQLVSLTGEESGGIVNDALYGTFIDDLTKFKSSGSDLNYQKLVKSFANLQGNYKMGKDEVEEVRKQITATANNLASQKAIALRYSSPDIAKAIGTSTEASVTAMLNASKKDPQWKAVVTDAWAKNAAEGQSYDDFAKGYIEALLGTGTPDVQIVRDINETQGNIVEDDNETRNNIVENNNASQNTLNEISARNAGSGGTGSDGGIAATKVGNYDVPNNIVERFEDSDVPIQIAAQMTDLYNQEIAAGKSDEQATTAVKDKYKSYLTEDNNIPTIVEDFFNIATPASADSIETAPPAIPTSTTLTVPNVGSINTITGLSLEESLVIGNESSGATQLVNIDDQGQPSVGPHMFRGAKAQEFLAKFYPDISKKFNLTKGPLSAEQGNALQAELSNKGDLVTNSSDFFKSEFLRSTQDIYKETFKEEIGNEDFILHSMAVNHGVAGQKIIMEKAKKLKEAGLPITQALTEARINYVKGEYREGENKGVSFIQGDNADQILIQLEQRYKNEQAAAENADVIREASTQQYLSRFNSRRVQSAEASSEVQSITQPQGPEPIPAEQVESEQLETLENRKKLIPEKDQFGRSNVSQIEEIDNQIAEIERVRVNRKNREEELTNAQTLASKRAEELKPEEPTTLFGNMEVTKSTTEPPEYLLIDKGASVFSEAKRGIIMSRTEFEIWLTNNIGRLESE